ncbi:MAG: AMP-dependent synthetase, partial [Nioella sp.]|nr:AMP-dependent synthetase [Nioella sp.]
MTIAQWLQATAEAHPARPALYLGHDLIEDYAGFHAAAARVAAALVGMGVTPGDRVALFLKNTPDYLIALFGAWYAGAAVVPVNAKLHPAEVAWILSNAGARLCFASPDLARGLPALTDAQILTEVPQAAPLAAPVPRAPDDLAWLFYTSGTTGRPKGVTITHAMLTAMSDAYLADVDAVRAQDAALYAAPLSHGAGLYS